MDHDPYGLILKVQSEIAASVRDSNALLGTLDKINVLVSKSRIAVAKSRALRDSWRELSFDGPICGGGEWRSKSNQDTTRSFYYQDNFRSIV